MVVKLKFRQITG